MRKRALIGTTVPAQQRLPRDKIGDRKGFYPEPSNSNRRGTHLNVVSQVLRQGEQGISTVNWETFGAFGSRSKVEQGKRKRKSKPKRKMRLQNSPAPPIKARAGKFDTRTGRWHVKHDQSRYDTELLSYAELVKHCEASSKPVRIRKAIKRNGFL